MIMRVMLLPSCCQTQHSYLVAFFLISTCWLSTTNSNTFTLATALVSPSPTHVECHAHERAALLQFKNSFIIDCNVFEYAIADPPIKSWSGDGDCCSWDGVICDERTGHVIVLDLEQSCLYGSFPSNSSIFTLSRLQMLRLSYNYFNNSQIPSQVGQLSKLTILDLSSSAFSGQIPLEISQLSELAFLDLSNNSPLLTLIEDSSFEKLVGNLTGLEYLSLSTVDISSAVPSILGNVTSLKAIYLESCNLHGDLPKGIFRLPQLENISLSDNPNLKGSFPDFQQNSPLTRLRLEWTSFYGEIPPSIGNLAQLEVLSLLKCPLSGPIPSSLSNLTNLFLLELVANDFSGDIPSLQNSTQLQILALSNLNVNLDKLSSWLFKLNNLSFLQLLNLNLKGEFPPYLTNFTGLTHLDLSGNQLQGQIPQGISRLENLTYLSLADNNNFILENFEETFSKLKSLQYLDLSGIKLTFPAADNVAGQNDSLLRVKQLYLSSCNLIEFPLFLHNQGELQELDLSDNSIHGVIPQWLVIITADSLYSLRLSKNFITGFEQPTDQVVLPWSQLAELDLSSNNIRGSLPIPPLNSIVLYQVSNNSFDGGIPKQLCHASSLRSLDLSFNNLSGWIPECVGQLGVLAALNLQGNKFHGTIPHAYPKSCQLQMINLSQNQLEGNIPRSLANCAKLAVLDIGNNQVNDTFPSWLGALPQLQILVLRYNNFHGRIRMNKGADSAFRSLRIIDVSHNFHTGELPSDYLQNWDAMKHAKEDHGRASRVVVRYQFYAPHLGQVTNFVPYDYSITITNKGSEMTYQKILTVFRVIDFSSNNFSGKIPSLIGELKGLEALNVSNNILDGNIPSSLSDMRNLESLDLSNNMLAGNIPRGFVQLTSLEVFNVSHNHLVGPIPQGQQFNTFDNSSFEGNIGLCGAPLSKKCTNNANEPPQPPDLTTIDEKDQDSKSIDWIVRSLGCVGGFVAGCAIGKYITDCNHDWFVDTFEERRRRMRNRKAKTRGRTLPQNRS